MSELSYLKVFLDWIEATEKLNDADKGRLIDAMVRYARGEENADSRLKGNEAYLFPIFRLQIDRDKAEIEKKRQTNAENGSKGGAPKGNQNARKNNRNQPKSTETSQTKTRTNDKDKDKDEDKDDKSGRRPQISPAADLSPSSPSPYDLDFGQVMSALLNFIPEAPQSALEQLRAYYETCGRDVCLRAIDIARGERKASWNYIAAILRNKSAAEIRTLADWDKAEREWRGDNGGGNAGRNAQSGVSGANAGKREISADEAWGITPNW